MRARRILSAALGLAGVALMALSVSVALADTTVHIKESNNLYMFTPKAITVAVGDTVTWHNDSDARHTVSADNGAFDHGAFGQGADVSQTFKTAGTFAYHCNFHSYMHATVVVLAAGLTPPPTDTAPDAPAGPNGSWIVLVALGVVMLGGALYIQRRRTA